MGAVVVAYSGGVDSAYLACIAHETLGDRALAVTADSPSYPQRHREMALQIAGQFGLRHRIVQTRELERPEYRANPPNRCYFCKHELYSHLTAIAAELGAVVVDGNNADDRGDYRPGRQAAREFGVRSPLDEVDLGKDEIRALSREAGLPTWDEPASACLSSRIPYQSEVTDEKLRMIEAAEQVLRALGFRVCRVRHHDDLARVELGRDELARAVRARSRSQHRARIEADWLSLRHRRFAGLPHRQSQRRSPAPSRVTASTRLAAILAVAVLALHLPYLPASLEDLDSINFALGVRHFDVAQHQPHPPGYPLFMFLAKAVNAFSGPRRTRSAWSAPSAPRSRCSRWRRSSARGRRSRRRPGRRIFPCCSPRPRLSSG